ncbi:MAG: DUF983 domain-containing protein [Saprospiraceae bacterium]
MKKCPRCQEGDLFIAPFEFSNPVNMPQQCSVCQQKFEPEPGFYYGALFLSYIMTAFLFLGIIAVCIIYLGLSLRYSMFIVLLVAATTYIFFMRLARSIWINIMIKYNPDAKNDKGTQTFGY